MIWIIAIAILLLCYWVRRVLQIQAEMKEARHKQFLLREKMKKELEDIEKRNEEIRLRTVMAKTISPTNPPVSKKVTTEVKERKIERSVYDTYQEDYDRRHRRDNSDDILSTVVTGIAIASMFDDSSSSSSSYDSGSSDYSGGGGDFSGGGSSGEW